MFAEYVDICRLFELSQEMTGSSAEFPPVSMANTVACFAVFDVEMIWTDETTPEVNP